MAFACCDFCYQKYLSEDKTVDEEFILTNFGDESKCMKVGTELIVISSGTKTKLCNCDCHVHGWHVFH